MTMGARELSSPVTMYDGASIPVPGYPTGRGRSAKIAMAKAHREDWNSFQLAIIRYRMDLVYTGSAPSAKIRLGVACIADIRDRTSLPQSRQQSIQEESHDAT
eukprot:3059488-Rhodomonas_salina.1